MTTSLTFRPPNPRLPFLIHLDAVHLLAEKEQGPGGGVALTAYLCPAGVWTIGWGETQDVEEGDTCTVEDADRWFCEGVNERARQVLRLCTIKPTQLQLGAMVCLSYNIGIGAFGKSTVLKAHNRGDFIAAGEAFKLFDSVRDKATGKLVKVRGLKIRRAQEAAMYLRGMPASQETELTPQEVAPESKLTDSPLVRAGAAVVAGGGGVVATAPAPAPVPEAAPALAAQVTEVANTAGQLGGVLDVVNRGVDMLAGMPPVALVGLAIMAVGVAVILIRRNQRRLGWA